MLVHCNSPSHTYSTGCNHPLLLPVRMIAGQCKVYVLP
jgi:hypothetical protein